MSAMQSWCYIVGIHPKNLTKEEILLLEAELFIRICAELKEQQRIQYKDYFRLMKFTVEMENAMLEANFLRLIIHDIIATEEYDLRGIAYYTNTHEDVVQEIASGCNTRPSAILLQRTIELHRSVRRDLYYAIMKKISSEYAIAV